MTVRHSVIIPVLNGTAHIGEALVSALSQLGDEDEVLVVDNGSTDGTPELVRGFGDPRIRLLHEPAPGPSAARNAGLRAARGTLVSFLDHDDLWPAGRTAGLLETLERNPQADAALGRFRVRFDGEVETALMHLDGMTSDVLHLGPFLFRAALIREAGLFDQQLRFGEDIDYLLRLRRLAMRCDRWDGDALIYRRHASNMTLGRDPGREGSFAAVKRHLARRRAAAEEAMR